MAGRLEKKYVWPTGQTPSEGLSTAQTNFWQFRRTFWGKKVRLAARPAFGQPRKNLKYSIFECIKWHYILNVAYCYIHDGFLPLSPKKSKNASESDVVVLRNSKIEHVLPYKSLTKQDIALRFGQVVLWTISIRCGFLLHDGFLPLRGRKMRRKVTTFWSRMNVQRKSGLESL